MTKTPPPRANPTPSSPATPTVDARTLRIRTLNDRLRITFAGGAVVKSAGFAALPIDLQVTIFGHIQRFDGFSPPKDPKTRTPNMTSAASSLPASSFCSRSTITTPPCAFTPTIPLTPPRPAAS